MQVKIRSELVTVSSYEEASARVREAIDASGIGNSRYIFGQIFEGDEQIAHVSYNGRVWAGKEWISGRAALFDPYAVAE